jgi:hypothetical protein
MHGCSGMQHDMGRALNNCDTPECQVISLHYIALHSLDPELVKITLGCEIWHINTKKYVQYN